MSQLRPTLYFKHVYIEQSLYEGIDFLAKLRHTTIKQMTKDLLSKGFSVEIGSLIDQSIKEAKAREEAGQRRRPNSFVIALRKLAQKQGYDIKKFI
jgi:curved DNA-binding protein CbpA